MFTNTCTLRSRQPSRRHTVFGALLIVALAAAACGSATDDASPALAESTTTAPPADPEVETTLREERAGTTDETVAPVGSESADGTEHTDDADHAGADADDHDQTASGGASGELITEAADGTPEIGVAVEPGDAVPAGAYALNVLGEDWRLQIDQPILLDGSDTVTFGFTTEALRGTRHILGIFATVGIVPPSEVGIHQEHDPIVPDVTIAIPEDLDTWLEAVPQLTVVDRGTSTVAGAPATWYRLAVDPAAGQTFHCPFGDNCAGFVVHPRFGVTVLAPEIDVTVWQLDAVPGVMPWVQVEDPANVESAQQAMANLLAGLEAV